MIRSVSQIKPFKAPTSEMIREIFGEQVNGLKDFSIAHITISPKSAGQSHFHPEHYELYYMLSGELTVTLDNVDRVMRANDALLVDKQVIHNARNDADQDAVFLAFCSPAWTPECSEFVGNN